MEFAMLSLKSKIQALQYKETVWREKLRVIRGRRFILTITAAIQLIGLLILPSASMAADKTQDDLISTIVKIARDEYRKHSWKWTEYEKQFTRYMSEDKFAFYCIGIARYEHRRGAKWQIDWRAKSPVYNAAGRLVSYDYGVMQINSRTGEKYFRHLNYKNSIVDNIRAGVKHLAAGFNEAYFKGFSGLDAINYGLQFYNPCETNRVEKIWNYIPDYIKQQVQFISLKEKEPGT